MIEVKSVDYQVQMKLETFLSNCQKNIKTAISQVTEIGITSNKVSKISYAYFKNITKYANEAQQVIGKTELIAKKTESIVKKRIGNSAVYASQRFIQFSTLATREYRKTQKVFTEMALLGYADLETLRKSAVLFSNQWSGVTREQFISAAYDIKSSISTLSDEGVIEFTKLAQLTSKVARTSIKEMTSLFAIGYKLYRGFYSSDEKFGKAFAAGITESIKRFNKGSKEFSAAIESLGVTATKAGISFSEQLSVLGMLQETMSASYAGTAYAKFLQTTIKAGNNLKISFLDSNNQLKSMHEMLESIQFKYGQTLGVIEHNQLFEAFGNTESVQVIDILYSKTVELRCNIDAITNATKNGTTSIESMASTMDSEFSSKIAIIKQIWANLMEEVGQQIEPALLPMLDEIIAKLQEMQRAGDFTALGQSIKNLIEAFSQILTQIINMAPSAIAELTSAIQLLADNLQSVISALKTILYLWEAFKTVSEVISTIKQLIEVFKILTAVVLNFKTIFAALKSLLKKNIFGFIIFGIISVIEWFSKLTEGIESWRDKFKFAILDIQIKFEKFCRSLIVAIQKVVGFFSKSMAAALDGAIDYFNKSIAKTEKEADKIKKNSKDDNTKSNKDKDEESKTKNNNSKKKTKDKKKKNNDKKTQDKKNKDNDKKTQDKKNKNDNKKSKDKKQQKKNKKEEKSPKPKEQKNTKDEKKLQDNKQQQNKKENSDNKEEQKKKTQTEASDEKQNKKEKQVQQDNTYDIFQEEELSLQYSLTETEELSLGSTQLYDANADIGQESDNSTYESINNIEEKYSLELENKELKTDLAESQNKQEEAAQYKKESRTLLEMQANELLQLEANATGESKIIIENARLKTLQKIQNLAEDIRDGINIITGEFNTPANIKSMTQYEYMVKNGNVSQSKYYGNKNIEVHFNVKNLENLSQKQLQDYMHKMVTYMGVGIGSDPFGDLVHDEGRR